MPESEKNFNPQESEKNKEFIEIENFLIEPTADYSRLISENRYWSRCGLNMDEEKSREAYFSSYNEFLTGSYDEYKSSLEKPENERDDYDKEIIQYWETLKSKIVGKILIDLGAGEVKNDLRNLAHELGATTYIRVDAFNPWEGEASQYGWDAKRDLSKGEMLGETQIITIKDDMLDFLSRLPEDESICFVINGLIITDLAYNKTLLTEIERVLSPGNIVFGLGAASKDLLEMGQEDPSFKNLVQSFFMRWKILEKTEK